MSKLRVPTSQGLWGVHILKVYYDFAYTKRLSIALFRTVSKSKACAIFEMFLLGLDTVVRLYKVKFSSILEVNSLTLDVLDEGVCNCANLCFCSSIIYNTYLRRQLNPKCMWFFCFRINYLLAWVGGLPHKLFKSYLSDRILSININTIICILVFQRALY